MNIHHPNWRRRCELPDASVLDAALQYEEARRILWSKMQPGCGILLPTLNTAAVSIELYLKSMAAHLIHTPDGTIDGLYRVTSEADTRNHRLTMLFDAIPEDVRDSLQTSYSSRNPGLSIRDDLDTLEGLFEASRYPFEKRHDLSQYALVTIDRMCLFLAAFVEALPPREWIEN